MAETVTLVVEKLIPLISEEAKLLTGIHKEVETIRDELQSITAFLVEADAREARGESDRTLRTWVKQVRDVAYDIEDVLDEYMHHVARRRQEKGFYRIVRMIYRSVRKLVTRHEIASKIADINRKFVDIKDRAGRYELIGSTQQQTTTPSQMRSTFCGEAELVGIQGPRDELLRLLKLEKDGDEEEKKRKVLSVVGMGGLGKTTLTRKVYDGQIGSFDCHAWVTVSQTYIKEQLLKSIIRQFYKAQKEVVPATIEAMDEIDALVGELRTYVDTKRYVVVFDDVWSKEFCEQMTYALPENDKGSRIIFTTRSEDVAPPSAQSPPCYVYKLPLLPFGESFELFRRKVFQTCDGGPCPPELKELSEGIVKKCGGLPLAIITVGGVLSRKAKNIFEWKKFHDSLGSNLQGNEQLARVFSLSYHDLSPNLKSCLLYFSIYPEDYSVRCSRLIRQWIAEGFVKAQGGQELEDVAEEYLGELIRRCVIQVSELDHRDRVKECRVHDLIRDFILLKSKDMRFCGVLGETVDGKYCRRISMVGHDLNMDDVYGKVPVIRSVFVFQSIEFPKNLMRGLFGNSKLVTVLDLEGSRVKWLDESVGDLFHLQYLSVRDTEVEMLPKSIGRLEQLETLDIKRTRVRKLPIEIKRLRKLRHLLAYGYDDDAVTTWDHLRGVQIQEGLGCWETLQKLNGVEAKSGTVIKDLIKFRKLRKLGIYKVRGEDVIHLCKAIEKMEELRALWLMSVDAQQVTDLESIHSPPSFLQTMSLRCRLEALPSWIPKLHHLVRLYFSWSGLTDDPLGVLQHLPNLLDFGMKDNAYRGEQLHFKRGGFPKLNSLALSNLKVLKHLTIEQGALLCLQSLYLIRLDEFKHLTIEQGALPCLQEMNMGPVSPQMMEVPSCIKHLKNLEFMVLRDFSEEFYMKMVPDGPSWSIIQHIPTVLFDFSNESHYFTPADYQDHKVNN